MREAPRFLRTLFKRRSANIPQEWHLPLRSFCKHHDAFLQHSCILLNNRSHWKWGLVYASFSWSALHIRSRVQAPTVPGPMHGIDQLISRWFHINIVTLDLACSICIFHDGKVRRHAAPYQYQTQLSGTVWRSGRQIRDQSIHGHLGIVIKITHMCFSKRRMFNSLACRHDCID